MDVTFDDFQNNMNIDFMFSYKKKGKGDMTNTKMYVFLEQIIIISLPDKTITWMNDKFALRIKCFRTFTIDIQCKSYNSVGK